MKNLLIFLLSAFAFSGCNSTDRALLSCHNLYGEETQLLDDCYAGVGNAEAAALAFAKKQRLIPIVSVPDNDEIQASKIEAHTACVVRTEKSSRDPHEQTVRQLACEHGIRNYIEQIQFLNRLVGQGRGN